jgi:hypothetical protein
MALLAAVRSSLDDFAKVPVSELAAGDASRERFKPSHVFFTPTTPRTFLLAGSRVQTAGVVSVASAPFWYDDGREIYHQRGCLVSTK